MTYKRIAIDPSKHVFTLHGADEQERPVLRHDLKRHQVEAFFAKLPPTEVVLEACGGSHHRGRVLQRLGHKVRNRQTGHRIGLVRARSMTSRARCIRRVHPTTPRSADCWSAAPPRGILVWVTEG